jgi:hypothetical protein
MEGFLVLIFGKDLVWLAGFDLRPSGYGELAHEELAIASDNGFRGV